MHGKDGFALDRFILLLVIETHAKILNILLARYLWSLLTRSYVGVECRKWIHMTLICI